jgi:hypothetical protein
VRVSSSTTTGHRRSAPASCAPACTSRRAPSSPSTTSSERCSRLSAITSVVAIRCASWSCGRSGTPSSSCRCWGACASATPSSRSSRPTRPPSPPPAAGPPGLGPADLRRAKLPRRRRDHTRPRRPPARRPRPLGAAGVALRPRARPLGGLVAIGAAAISTSSATGMSLPFVPAQLCAIAMTALPAVTGAGLLVASTHRMRRADATAASSVR